MSHARFARPKIDILTHAQRVVAHPETVTNAGQVGNVFVLDSFSTDGTQELARRRGHGGGARVRELLGAEELGARQPPVRGEWVFILDARADHPALRDEPDVRRDRERARGTSSTACDLHGQRSVTAGCTRRGTCASSARSCRTRIGRCTSTWCATGPRVPQARDAAHPGARASPSTSPSTSGTRRWRATSGSRPAWARGVRQGAVAFPEPAG